MTQNNRERALRDLGRYTLKGVIIFSLILCLSYLLARIICMDVSPIPTYNITCYEGEKIIAHTQSAVFNNTRWWLDEDGNYLNFKKVNCVYELLEHNAEEPE